MRKSTLFISVVLTTFVLAVLFGVVSNQKAIQNTQTETVQTQTVTPTEQLTEVPAADQLRCNRVFGHVQFRRAGLCKPYRPDPGNHTAGTGGGRYQ
jgi:hypothetical protein